MLKGLFACWLIVRFPAAAIGWLIGKAIVGLVRGAIWLVQAAAYLVGAVGGWVVKIIHAAQRRPESGLRFKRPS